MTTDHPCKRFPSRVFYFFSFEIYFHKFLVFYNDEHNDTNQKFSAARRGIEYIPTPRLRQPTADNRPNKKKYSRFSKDRGEIRVHKIAAIVHVEAIRTDMEPQKRPARQTAWVSHHQQARRHLHKGNKSHRREWVGLHPVHPPASPARQHPEPNPGNDHARQAADGRDYNEEPHRAVCHRRCRRAR